MDTEDPVIAGKIARALGDQLRRNREALGLSREKFVRRLPSGLGTRALLAYEHAVRGLSMLRFLELCHALEVSAPDVLARALQNTQLYLDRLTLHVDLNMFLADQNINFRPMHLWARNRLNDTPNGVAEVTPSAIRELAAAYGHTQDEVARYMCKFTPGRDPHDLAA